MAYLHRVLRDVLHGLIDDVCLVWVDGVVIWGDTAEELVQPLEAVLTRRIERGLYTAAHKAVCFREEIR